MGGGLGPGSFLCFSQAEEELAGQAQELPIFWDEPLISESVQASDCTQGGARELPERWQRGEQPEMTGKVQLMPSEQETRLVTKQHCPSPLSVPDCPRHPTLLRGLLV